MKQRLETVETVIQTIYGTAAQAARELGRSRTAIWKYMQRGEFSGELYDPIQRDAFLKGYIVADELFTPVTVHPSMITKGA